MKRAFTPNLTSNSNIDFFFFFNNRRKPRCNCEGKINLTSINNFTKLTQIEI